MSNESRLHRKREHIGSKKEVSSNLRNYIILDNLLFLYDKNKLAKSTHPTGEQHAYFISCGSERVHK